MLISKYDNPWCFLSLWIILITLTKGTGCCYLSSKLKCPCMSHLYSIPFHFSPFCGRAFKLYLSTPRSCWVNSHLRIVLNQIWFKILRPWCVVVLRLVLEKQHMVPEGDLCLGNQSSWPGWDFPKFFNLCLPLSPGQAVELSVPCRLGLNSSAKQGWMRPKAFV